MTEASARLPVPSNELEALFYVYAICGNITPLFSLFLKFLSFCHVTTRFTIIILVLC